MRVHRVKRLEGIPGFSIDRVAAAAEGDPEILRLENLDTDLLPPAAALTASKKAIDEDDANSYLPFTGRTDLCQAVSDHLFQQTGHRYDAETEVCITSGGTEGLLDSLLAITDPGDEVIVTDPTYCGMINRTRLAGAVPKFVPFNLIGNEWRLDLNALKEAVTDRTRAFFIMSPSMPSGAMLDMQEWQTIVNFCVSRDIWLLYDAAMERIIYDNRPFIHPASLPEMADRTITVGSVSKEFRMIGWRLGWIVAPASIMKDIALTHIYNVVTPTGISQAAALEALRAPQSDLKNAVKEWEKRRNIIIEQLKGLPLIPAAGGWSMLLDVGRMGYNSFEASDLLLTIGKIAATPMRDWGVKNSDQFVRFVFSNEPVERLSDLRERVLKSLPIK
jgi:aspartate/methionine/tyrosine aminotransferase